MAILTAYPEDQAILASRQRELDCVEGIQRECFPKEHLLSHAKTLPSSELKMFVDELLDRVEKLQSGCPSNHEDYSDPSNDDSAICCGCGKFFYDSLGDDWCGCNNV
tara:strand:- start:354 stop:674 length:321 start_codon:yes stop_codon:yes gene_type:complete